jgi:hypothetical protein
MVSKELFGVSWDEGPLLKLTFFKQRTLRRKEYISEIKVRRSLRDQVIYKHSALTLDRCFFKLRTSTSKECARKLQAKHPEGTTPRDAYLPCDA